MISFLPRTRHQARSNAVPKGLRSMVTLVCWARRHAQAVGHARCPLAALLPDRQRGFLLPRPYQPQKNNSNCLIKNSNEPLGWCIFVQAKCYQRRAYHSTEGSENNLYGGCGASRSPRSVLEWGGGLAQPGLAKRAHVAQHAAWAGRTVEVAAPLPMKH